MALPNFLFYHWAANLQSVLYWVQFDPAVSPVWCLIESLSCAPASHSALISCPPDFNVSRFCKNIIVKITLWVWTQFCKHFGIQTLPVSVPLRKNPFLPPSLNDAAFEFWSQRGIVTITDLFVEGGFASFQQLADGFGLPTSHLFQYFQVRDFYSKVFNSFPNIPPDTPFDNMLKISSTLKGTISTIYHLISSLCSTSSQTLETLRAQDLGEDLTDLWGSILECVHSSSICARHGVIQCKLLHRVSWTKSRLGCVYPNIDPVCDRCRKNHGTLIHMFWLCPSLHTHWTSAFATLSDVLQITLEPSPLSALFGVLPDCIQMSKSKSDL